MLARLPTHVIACALVTFQFVGVGCAQAQRPSRGEGKRATRSVAGRTFYVAAQGSDGATGSASHPWRTVERVNVARLRPGDVVLFQGGERFDGQLMPARGYGAAGSAQAPIRFGSFGSGLAHLPDGIWFGADAEHPSGARYLVFERLALGTHGGVQGIGDFIVLRELQITDLTPPQSRSEIGIQSQGSHWTIANNHIDRTGNSGMILGFNANQAGEAAGGTGYVVTGNVVTRTGMDPSIGYPMHGIYLKVAKARVEHNQIIGFHNDGVSARYHDATIRRNYIAGGEIGIAWYQYDTVGGVSRFEFNTIEQTSEAGIFVCGEREGCRRPLERFVIRDDIVRPARGPRLNLQPAASGYQVSGVR